MKKRIFALILSVLMLLPVMGTITAFADDEIVEFAEEENVNLDEERYSKMEVVTKDFNGNYELRIDKKTGEMGVKYLKTGEILLTNASEASKLEITNESGGIVTSVAERLSQVLLNFTIISTGNAVQLNSYEHFFAKNAEDGIEADIQPIPNGVQVHYILRKDAYYFSFNVDYTITEDGFTACLDASSLEYDKGNIYVNTITLLPEFSAAKRTDKGYILLPDGSGTLVRFEDVLAKNYQGIIAEDMYGIDNTYHYITIKHTQQYTMPVFGLVNSSKANGTGYLAVIEEGEALARPTSSHTQYFNSAYATFKITPDDKYDFASFSNGNQTNKEVTIVGSQAYQGKCKVIYKFLTSDETAKNCGLENNYDTSYVGMAKLYRDYLTEKGALTKLEDASEDVKLFLEVFGSIQVEEKILTFPWTVNKALTTFDDVITMRNYFSNKEENKIAAAKNITFILKGFANGGIISNYPTSIDWQGDVGGWDGMVNLLQNAKENGYEVAPEIDLTYSYGTTWFSGYSNDNNGVRTLDNRFSTKRIYYASTQTFERTGGVAVSSSSFSYIYDKLYESIKDLELEYLAPRTFGSDLNSDFDKDDFNTREDSKNNVISVLANLNKGDDYKKGYGLILDKGNSYAIPYASAILSATLDGSRRTKTSESVPFFGMVYHGSLEFAGDALNTEGDSKYMFLKAIENGASLYYTIAMQNYEYLKFDESYNKYYSISYDHLKDTILTTYNEYNQLMKGLQDDYIVDHVFLNSEDGYDVRRVEDNQALNSSLVVMVTYENGTSFILNYNDYAVSVDLGDGTPVIIDGLGYYQTATNG
ncbi:MAG: hypothetical protein IJ309_00545 [Clostridia bacterium]|nr:hypothetical protein [Clostridia bacterium]